MITAAVVTTAVFSLPPLVDIGHPGIRVTAALRTPLAYNVVAPVSDVLDALTLVFPAQCAATFVLCCVVALGFWTYRRARSPASMVPHKLLRPSLCFVGGAIAIAGITLVAARPMASIALADRDLIAIDFHSHTEASHDGRSGFDAERNREWHASAGFDAAYVTDHQTFDGALSGAGRNPARSGDGMVLLPGVELRDGDQHPILIGVDPMRMRITSPDWGAAAVEADGGAAPPILLLSLPGDIEHVPLDETNGPVRLAGIEAVDGSPRGMAQSAHERDAIFSLAGQMHLAVISASDNHGWGRTAPAWSVMRIPGWRAMTPSGLDIAIRRTIIDEGPRAVDVIARRTAPAPTNKLETAGGGIMVAITMMRTMSMPERASWIGWSWGLCFLSLGIARRNAIKQRARDRKRAERKLRPVIDAAA